MKRLVFELILILSLVVLSYQYYSSYITKTNELREVYQMLIKSDDIKEEQRRAIIKQQTVIEKLARDVLTLQDECDKLFQKLPFYQKGEAI